MNIVMKYIMNGKGYGLKILTFFSILLALILGGATYYQVNAYLNSKEVQEFVKNVPVLEIKDHKLVAPTDTYVNLKYPDMEGAFFVINTRSGDLDLMHFDTAFYLTPERIYVKAGPNIQTIDYDQDITITPDLIHKTIYATSILMPVFFGISLLLFIWIGYGFLYFVSKLFSWLIKKTIQPDMRGRIVLFAWITVLLIDFMFSFLGWGFSLSMAFIWAFILIALIMLKISDSEPVI